MIPTTAHRVEKNTSARVNRRIECESLGNVARYAAQGPDAIARRLARLDREWDIERILEANAAGVSLFGIFLATRHRGWLALPMTVAAFLLLHAIQGWCPPVPILRRLGFRTAREIDQERTALKALRGDFAYIEATQGDGAARRAFEAAQF